MQKILIILGIVGVSVVTLGIYFRRRDQRLIKQRAGWTKVQFVDTLAAKGISRGVAEALYGTLSERTKVPVCPGDDLYTVYGLCEEDLDETVLDVVNSLGLRKPSAADTVGMKPIRTVEDVAVFLTKLA